MSHNPAVLRDRKRFKYCAPIPPPAPLPVPITPVIVEITTVDYYWVNQCSIYIRPLAPDTPPTYPILYYLFAINNIIHYTQIPPGDQTPGFQILIDIDSLNDYNIIKDGTTSGNYSTLTLFAVNQNGMSSPSIPSPLILVISS
jgi:hypothetical protein